MWMRIVFPGWEKKTRESGSFTEKVGKAIFCVVISNQTTQPWLYDDNDEHDDGDAFSKLNFLLWFFSLHFQHESGWTHNDFLCH